MFIEHLCTFLLFYPSHSGSLNGSTTHSTMLTAVDDCIFSPKSFYIFTERVHVWSRFPCLFSGLKGFLSSHRGYFSFLHMTYQWVLFYFYFLFYGCTWDIWKFPGKGLNLNRAAAETQAAAVWFLTHWATHSMNSQRDLVSSFLQDDSLLLTKVIVQEKKQSGKNFKDLPLFSYLLDLPNISDHLCILNHILDL